MPFGEALLGLLPFTTLSASFVLILLHVPGFLSHNFTVALLGLGVAFSNIVGMLCFSIGCGPDHVSKPDTVFHTHTHINRPHHC